MVLGHCDSAVKRGLGPVGELVGTGPALVDSAESDSVSALLIIRLAAGICRSLISVFVCA